MTEIVSRVLLAAMKIFTSILALTLAVTLSVRTFAADDEVAVVKTNMGTMVLEFWADVAPKHVENFKTLAKKGFYDGTAFHRVIKDFMIQGGGFEPGMKQKPCAAPIENEANNGLHNDIYTVAMARTSDPHSATAQFFINVTDNDFLNFKSPSTSNWGYAVFAKVVAGTDIVDKLEGVKTGSNGFHQDVPKEAVVIEKAVLV